MTLHNRPISGRMSGGGPIWCYITDPSVVGWWVKVALYYATSQTHTWKDDEWRWPHMMPHNRPIHSRVMSEGGPIWHYITDPFMSGWVKVAPYDSTQQTHQRQDDEWRWLHMTLHNRPISGRIMSEGGPIWHYITDPSVAGWWVKVAPYDTTQQSHQWQDNEWR